MYLYVDDLTFISRSPFFFNDFRKIITNEVEVTDIGLMAYYVGIEVRQKEVGIFSLQKWYIKENSRSSR